MDPINSFIDTLTGPMILKTVFAGLLILALLLLTLFAWTTIKQIRLLNATVKTPLARYFSSIAVLFFVFCVGTLFIAFNLWIKPLI